MKVAMLGLTGAGKGTQAGKIEETYDIPHISTGDLLRDNLDQKLDTDGAPVTGDTYEETIGERLDEGKSIPTETMTYFLEQRLDEDDCQDGYVLDGFPRWKEQAEIMDDLDELDAVVYLRVDDEAVLYDRLLDRGREDDDRETIAERLDWQRPAVQEVYEHYRDHGSVELIEIDGERSIDAVWEDLHRRLEAL
jgi:adenylate kinase